MHVLIDVADCMRVRSASADFASAVDVGSAAAETESDRHEQKQLSTGYIGQAYGSANRNMTVQASLCTVITLEAFIRRAEASVLRCQSPSAAVVVERDGRVAHGTVAWVGGVFGPALLSDVKIRRLTHEAMCLRLTSRHSTVQTPRGSFGLSDFLFGSPILHDVFVTPPSIPACSLRSTSGTSATS